MLGKILYLVVPCYNEEEVLPLAAVEIAKKMDSLIESQKISSKSRVLLVDDGSRDKTWEIISALHDKNKLFGGLKLSRNCGHQQALYSGLMAAKECADIVISMDADLQDDINAIDEFIEKNNQGCEVVYGVRNSRKTDSFFKRNTALMFYKIMSFLGTETIYNHADYRLMSKQVCDGLSEFKESNLFLRGIIPQIGFKSDCVYYDRNARAAGESKYPFKKMMAFAVNGITSFSFKPLKLIFNLGLIVSVISVFMLAYTLIVKFFGHTVEGWTFTVASVWFIGGLQMLSLGICGEYIGKIYSETKERPKYIVESFINSVD